MAHLFKFYHRSPLVAMFSYRACALFFFFFNKQNEYILASVTYEREKTHVPCRYLSSIYCHDKGIFLSSVVPLAYTGRVLFDFIVLRFVPSMVLSEKKMEYRQ